jgi:hypothetical protein
MHFPEEYFKAYEIAKGRIFTVGENIENIKLLRITKYLILVEENVSNQ